MRSASAIALTLLGAAALAGCATTQQLSARAGVRAQRTLASRRALFVTHVNRDVAVLAATLVHGRHGRAAVVVRLRNRRGAAVSDLPLSVGVRLPGGRLAVLNRRGGLPYFQTHAPVLPARATVTWVFLARRPIPSGARPFARVGRPVPHPPTRVRALPQLDVSVAHRRERASVAATLVNDSDVPQYDLDVYAWAARGHRVVAAGRVRVPHLGTHARRTLAIPLVGDAHGADVHVAAPPTLFQ
ncbi:MAG TPA: hypothetical protein VE972_05265 [Conexibacter sp.]|nr:hypothetical protein [Conexibacter sp.]